MQDDRWLSPSQVAYYLQFSLDTVLRQLRSGALPAGRIGRQWRIRPANLEAYLRRGPARVATARPAGAEVAASLPTPEMAEERAHA
jgi:excisionase family DNA binding protein